MTSIRSAINRSYVFAIAITLFSSSLAFMSRSGVTEASAVNTAGRTMRAVSTDAVPGGDATVSIEFDSLGDEVALSFSLNFDPATLNTPVITLGSGVPAGTAITINQNQVANGRIGFLLDSMNPYLVSPPSRQVVLIKFKVAATAAAGPTLVSFGDSPTGRSTSNVFGMLVPTTYGGCSVNVGAPQAQTVDISGRVITPAGLGLRNAVVTLIDASNNRRSVSTGSLGFFTFSDVEPGQSYTVIAASRQYRFDPRTVFAGASISDLSFVGMQ